LETSRTDQLWPRRGKGLYRNFNKGALIQVSTKRKLLEHLKNVSPLRGQDKNNLYKKTF
jgi:hypothetical protein